MTEFDYKDFWRKTYKDYHNMRYYSFLTMLPGAVLLFTVFAIQSNNSLKGLLGIGIGLVIILIGFYLFVTSVTQIGNINRWKRQVAKNEEAIKKIAAGMEYQAELMGLEPVNKIEFRKIP
jgi:hypothetical protein